MKDDKSKPRSFFEELVEKKHRKPFEFSAAAFVPNSLEFSPPKVVEALGIPDEGLSDIAKRAISSLEENEDERWLKFRWRVLAFLELQDLFGFALYDEDSLEDGAALWYFYYESKFLLAEAFVAGLNGLYQSSSALMRPLIEFSVQQNYFYRTSQNDQSYERLKKYFVSGISPKWTRALSQSLCAHPISRPIRKRIETLYAGFSDSLSHPHKPRSSPKHVTQSGSPGHSHVGLISFWMTIDMALESILWLYFQNLPMAFHPKDPIKKFGFNGPVGLFVDPAQSIAFKNALLESDYREFLEFSSLQSEVSDLSKWYDSFEDLTADQIIETWDHERKGKIPDPMEMAIAHQRAFLRTSNEAICFKITSREQYSDFEFEKIKFDLGFWRKLDKAKNK